MLQRALWVISRHKPVLVAIAGFTVIGSVLVLSTQAATFAANSESEAGQIAGAATTVDAIGSSAGRSVLFGSNLQSGKRDYGVLQSSLQRLDQTYSAGARVVTVELGWNRYQPAENTYDTAYINSVKSQVAAYRAKGMKMILCFGVQYPPSWLLSGSNVRYVNQFGASYASSESGKNIGNMVFNQALRSKYEIYMQRVLQDLGTDFYAVRLGGGWYDELNYPEHNYNGQTNSYWGFDAIAKGQAAGLPPGVSVNPVPGWIPGSASADHSQASRFANWYMDSLGQYQSWQIRTARKYYAGKLIMMYPSWGVRPGQLDQAIARDLNGTTSPEINGEVQRGFDFARYVASINDPKVMVYTTWIDAPFGSDDSADESQWRPIHWLSALAARNPLRLQAGGENTGHNDLAAMQFSFSQADKYDAALLMWAFEPELYDGQHATADQFRALVLQ